MASILLGESDPDVRQLLTVLLERLGHDVIVLNGGSELPPHADLLLFEPVVPEWLEIAWLVRLRDPDLPIICVSIVPHEAAFLALGPLAYLEKPFGLSALEDAIEKALLRAPSLA